MIHARSTTNGIRAGIGLLLLAHLASAQGQWIRRAAGDPSRRSHTATAYEAARERTILFGGLEAGGARADTWAWDGARWNLLYPARRPPARYGHALAYDAGRKRVVLFGGQDGTRYFADTWEWDGFAWTQRAPSTSPPMRAFHAMAYDSIRGRIVLFGGTQGFLKERNDTWEWDGADWVQRFPGTSPAAVQGHALAYDPVRKQTVLFGGLATSQYGPPWFSDDTWVWNGTDWSKLNPRNRPGNFGLAGHAMAYDAIRNRTVLFGGQYESAGHHTYQTWVWDGTDWQDVTNYHGKNPAARIGSALAFDAKRQTTVLFGGENDQPTPGYDYLADTWAWDGKAWTLCRPAGGPPVRMQHALAHDAKRSRTVLFGGMDTTFTPLDETWEWDGVSWVQPKPAVSPSARVGHAMAFDPVRNRVVLVGPSGGNPALADTWEWDGVSWTERKPTTSPPARADHAIAWDGSRQRIVLFGGVHSSQVLADTWEWDGADWTQRKPAAGPPARSGHALAYDAKRKRIVLFGGERSYTCLDDTWEWDGTSWVQPSPASRPPARCGHSLVYDPARGRTVLFGGNDGQTSLSDTWEWDGATWTLASPATSPAARTHQAAAFHAARQRIVLVGGLGSGLDPSLLADHWEYVGAPCRVVGPGHSGGGLAIACTSLPRVGGSFGVTFSDPPPQGLGYHLLFLGPAPWLNPPIVVDPPLVCARAYLYVAPVFVLPGVGNPVVFPIGLPDIHELAGTEWCVQGASLEQGGCLRATDGLVVTLVP